MRERRKKSIFFIKTVVSYFTLLLVVVSIFMAALYRVYVSDSINTAMKNQQELANKTAQQIDAFIYETDQIAQQVTRTTSILNCFYKLQSETNTDNYFDEDIIGQIEMSSMLYTISGQKSPAYRVSVYNQYGDFVHTGELIYGNNSLTEHLNTAEVYSKMINLGYSSDTIIEAPVADWGGYDTGSYLSLYRALMNVYSTEPCGVVEVQRDIRQFDNILKFDTLENIVAEIYDKSGNIVYPAEKTENSREYYKTTSYSESSGWKIVLKQPMEQITGKNSTVLIIFIFMYTLFMIVAFFISYAVAQRITRPIIELSRSVSNFSIGNMRLKISSEDQIDEITELNNTFSDMLDRLTKSIEHEKTAYSMAMQAQMNPHFMYNTLSVISTAGAEGENERVVDMCVRLSQMLRYVSGFETSLVPLSDEIEHTRNYLSLMKARYEDYFEYTINVSDELMQMKVPKLIIQPLVENSFGHAFGDVEPPWELSINVYEKGNYWYINVSDNGSGISEERISEICEKAESEYMPFEQQKLGLGGLGLIGTIKRIRMILDENIGYKIEKNGDRGISITFYGEK